MYGYMSYGEGCEVYEVRGTSPQEMYGYTSYGEGCGVYEVRGMPPLLGRTPRLARRVMRRVLLLVHGAAMRSVRSVRRLRSR